MTHTATKTVRFAKVVERSGQPHVHTLWVPPEKDPELKQAQNAGRVMTVERSPSGGKTDVGFVGFDRARGKTGQLLIFPKSLKPFDGARVVGIKFDLVAQPKLAPAGALKNALVARNGRETRNTAHPPSSRATARTKFNKRTALVSDAIPFESSAAERKPGTHAVPELLAAPSFSKPKVSRAPKQPPAANGLIREIRAAMKDLQRGKSIAAYQRLERAIASGR